MADKKQFSNTKSIVKVETGIATLILQDKILVSPRYDYVTLIPIVLQLGLRIGPIQRMGAN
jgi:hypothetical protein